jgi:NodT family efflux transporter outer membrane factor (OMF) lipoprotein
MRDLLSCQRKLASRKTELDASFRWHDRFCIITVITLLLFLTACAVGPNYVKPKVPVPLKYKEAPKGFKMADPKEICQRGAWWEIFNDPYLNRLEAKVNISNQNIATAAANYMNARALLGEARSQFFPQVSAVADLVRQKQGAGSTSFIADSGSSVSDGTAVTGGSGGGGKISTFHTLTIDASWETDLWGAIRRNVESNIAATQASYAQIAVARLSAEASLAQSYFQLRALDRDQKILDDTVREYQRFLQLTRNRYNTGVVSKSDVVQAESQLETAQSQAIANKIARQQTEHAIAVLMGIPPANLSIPFAPLTATPPPIPVDVPTELLERRPDIASAERQMAQANAQIGVAIAAFFPSLTLSANGSYTHQGFNRWISIPDSSWSLAAELAQILFDGGFHRSQVAAAKATYAANVATYKQTVLTAFQEVEDNLSSLYILKQQWVVENKAFQSAKTSLQLITNQYKAGTVDYTSVITAQNAALTAEKTAADIIGQEMVAAVGLIKALGGGWDASVMCLSAKPL